ncbi:hypothetical protein WJU23_04120 [Prosthecobacter sp. SYSU 5D2]|uniref:hypothetical protein n=1 Tax=Prosthecobacter sp. SYSU 5D2 TaxID=3134134 RepID=UPI0031FEF2C9
MSSLVTMAQESPLSCAALLWLYVGPRKSKDCGKDGSAGQGLERKKSKSKIVLELTDSEDWDNWAGGGRKAENYFPDCGIEFRQAPEGGTEAVPTQGWYEPTRYVWSKKAGWFSASYGPFRRFTGGDAEKKSVFYTHAILGRHLSVFGENVVLTESLEWLSQLRFEELDNNQSSGGLLKRIQTFIN